MKVRVKRFGGQLPQLQPETELDLATLGHSAQAAIRSLLTEKGSAERGPPDAYSYRFSVEQADGTSKTVTVPESAVPDAILKHLP
jgi:Emfourin